MHDSTNQMTNICVSPLNVNYMHVPSLLVPLEMSQCDQPGVGSADPQENVGRKTRWWRLDACCNLRLVSIQSELPLEMDKRLK